MMEAVKKQERMDGKNFESGDFVSLPRTQLNTEVADRCGARCGLATIIACSVHSMFVRGWRASFPVTISEELGKMQ